MADTQTTDPIDEFTRTCQILIGALLAGVIMFLIIIVFVIPEAGRLPPPGAAPAPAAAPGGTSILTIAAGAFGLAALAMSWVVPSAIVAGARRKLADDAGPPPVQARKASTGAGLGADMGSLLPLYQAQLIVGAALCEGAAFFAAIVYMLERDPLMLGLAFVLLAALASRFPTADRVRSWVDRQHEALLLERQGRAAR